MTSSPLNQAPTQHPVEMHHCPLPQTYPSTRAQHHLPRSPSPARYIKSELTRQVYTVNPFAMNPFNEPSWSMSALSSESTVMNEGSESEGEVERPRRIPRRPRPKPSRPSTSSQTTFTPNEPILAFTHLRPDDSLDLPQHQDKRLRSPEQSRHASTTFVSQSSPFSMSCSTDYDDDEDFRVAMRMI